MSSRQLLFLACFASAAVLSAGCGSGVRSKEPEAQVEAEPEPAAVKAADLPNGAVDPNAKGPFKRVFKLVEKQTAMEENPNYIVTVNTIEAGDYFTGVAQGAFAAASQLQTIGLQHFVNLHDAEHGDKPSLDDVKAYLNNNGLTLKGLYPYQVYAYDEETGVICILEDTAEKAKREGN